MPAAGLLVFCCNHAGPPPLGAVWASHPPLPAAVPCLRLILLPLSPTARANLHVSLHCRLYTRERGLSCRLPGALTFLPVCLFCLALAGLDLLLPRLDLLPPKCSFILRTLHGT